MGYGAASRGAGRDAGLDLSARGGDARHPLRLFRLPAARRDQRFYAHLYLGLYFEALGDAKLAREHITRAAEDFSENHYMGDVARVHLQLLNKTKSK